MEAVSLFISGSDNDGPSLYIVLEASGDFPIRNEAPVMTAGMPSEAAGNDDWLPHLTSNLVDPGERCIQKPRVVETPSGSRNPDAYYVGTWGNARGVSGGDASACRAMASRI